MTPRTPSPSSRCARRCTATSTSSARYGYSTPSSSGGTWAEGAAVLDVTPTPARTLLHDWATGRHQLYLDDVEQGRHPLLRRKAAVDGLTLTLVDGLCAAATLRLEAWLVAADLLATRTAT
ncbi:hypothetical protein [Streptomyces laurentii]|uniref:hypothetical protein n=1 Tax=Streptomyces laurentii TaxID=39478 RepID=UPI0036B1B310